MVLSPDHAAREQPHQFIKSFSFVSVASQDESVPTGHVDLSFHFCLLKSFSICNSRSIFLDLAYLMSFSE